MDTEPIKSKNYIVVMDEERDSILMLMLAVANEKPGHFLYHLKEDKLYDAFVSFYKEINIKSHEAGMCPEKECMFDKNNAQDGSTVLSKEPMGVDRELAKLTRLQKAAQTFIQAALDSKVPQIIFRLGGFTTPYMERGRWEISARQLEEGTPSPIGIMEL